MIRLTGMDGWLTLNVRFVFVGVATADQLESEVGKNGYFDEIVLFEGIVKSRVERHDAQLFCAYEHTKHSGFFQHIVYVTSTFRSAFI